MKFLDNFLDDFYWDCCESFSVFVNKKNKIVGIVDMYARHPIKYFFMNLFYKKTDTVKATKADYIRLYPKESANIQFKEDSIPPVPNKVNSVKYALEHGYNFEQF